MRFHLLVSITLLATSGVANAEQIHGRVINVTDGDTLTMLDTDNRQHRIRLAQIDAPEVGYGQKKHGQPFSEASRRSLAELVSGKRVQADCPQRDRYGRPVCQVTQDGVDVNLEQVKRGMAMAYRQYVADKQYVMHEQEARRLRLGLWREDKAPMAPWEWRRKQAEQ